MTKQRGLLKTVGSISLATMLSRVLGLVREQVRSYYFGAGFLTDAWLTAFRIPNLLRDLFAEGAMSSAFVPTFVAEKESRGNPAAFLLGNRMFGALITILGVLTLLIFFGAPWIVKFYVGGHNPEKLELAVQMTRIVSPFLLFIALAALAMGMLNAFGRFFLPAAAPIIFNLATILGMIFLAPVFQAAGMSPVLSIAAGAMIGGCLQFLVQLPALRAEGFRFRPKVAWKDPAVRKVARLMVPATFGLAATQISLFVDTSLAWSEGDGPVTWLNIGFRLMQLPLGLFGVAIATANLARVSHDAARKDMTALRGNLASSLRAAALLTLPATAGLIALRVPLVRVIFEHGKFNPSDTLHTAAAVLCYSLGLYAYSVTKIQVPTFYALGNVRLPVIASGSAVMVKIAASFLLMAVLPRYGVDAFLALALSTALAAWVNFSILSIALRKAVGGFRGCGVLSATFRMAGLALVMGVCVASLHAWLEQVLGGGGLAGEIGRLGAGVVAGAAIVFLGARILKIQEVQELFDKVIAPREGGEE
jgi:putative peptidoglycan lipid II flippase